MGEHPVASGQFSSFGT